MPLLTLCSIFIAFEIVIKGYSSALTECLTEKICAHPGTHVILCSETCKLWYHHVSTGSSGSGGVSLLVVVINQIVVVST